MDHLINRFMRYARTLRQNYKDENKSLGVSADSQFAAAAVIREAIENINLDVEVSATDISLDADFQPNIEIEPQFDITVDSKVSLDDSNISIDNSEVVNAIGDLDTMLVRIHKTFECIQKDVTRAVDLMYMNSGVWLDPAEEMQTNGKSEITDEDVREVVEKYMPKENS